MIKRIFLINVKAYLLQISSICYYAEFSLKVIKVEEIDDNCEIIFSM